jgi:hypothetical protein
MQLAIAVCLGIAAVIAKATESKGLRKSYQAVFWFEVSCATLALVILVFFVKIDSASAVLTQDERTGIELQTETEGTAHVRHSAAHENSTVVDSGVKNMEQRQEH